MALSTKTIQDTINWAKRLSFNRNPVIGNSLEPALTSAQMVMQTILGPPFSWWWNSQELSFTCNPTAQTGTITSVTVATNVVTILSVNTFSVGTMVFLSGLTTATYLNGKVVTILSASGTQFTFAYTHANVSIAADTGTATNITTQDYTVSSPLFSHIEHANLLDLDSDGAPLKWYELTIKDNLSRDSSSNRPDSMGPQTEDTSGNVTFRMMCSPDKAYPVTVQVQLAPPLVTSINQTWGPIPDFMQYVYDWGFLALMWHFADDPRAAYANDKFVAALLGRAQGISEQDRNIFLANWNNLPNSEALMTQMGVAARGR